MTKLKQPNTSYRMISHYDKNNIATLRIYLYEDTHSLNFMTFHLNEKNIYERKERNDDKDCVRFCRLNFYMVRLRGRFFDWEIRRNSIIKGLIEIFKINICSLRYPTEEMIAESKCGYLYI